MTNKSISQLSAGGAVAGTDLIPDVQTVGVGPVKVTADQLKTFMSASPTLVTPVLGVATGTSIALGGATLGANALAVTGTINFTSALTLGTQQTTQGSVVLANTAAGAFETTIKSSNSSSSAWTLTLPVNGGTNNYVLTTNGSGLSSWSQVSLTAGVTGVLPVLNGGTGVASLTSGYIPYGAGTSAFSSSSNFTYDGNNLNISSANSYTPQLVAWNQKNDSSGPYFFVKKSRSAAGAAVTAGDTLGTFIFGGYDSNGAYQNSAYLACTVAAVGAGNVDGTMNFLAYGSSSTITLTATSNVGLYSTAGNAYLNGGTANTFIVAGAEKARFTSAGNLLIGTQTTATSAVGTIHIYNGTAPSASLTNGGVLYVEGGALKYRGSGGTITTIAAS